MIETLIPIIQASLFYLLPTSIGRVIARRVIKQELSYPLITYFITGGFVLFLTALFIQYVLVTLISTLSFSSIFSGFVATAGVLSLLVNFLTPPKELKIKNLTLPITTALISAAVIFSIWRIDSPYSFNWDMLEHQTLVNTIFNDKFSFMTSRVTDTFGFDGYSSFFHTLIASSQVFYPTQMLVYWQAIGFIHFFLVILASYFLTKEITENTALAYISMLLAAGIFDSYVSFTSLFFIPQTFTAVVFIFLLAQLFKEIKQGKLLQTPILSFQALFLFLNHYIIGTAAVGIYLVIYLYSKYRLFIAQHINRAFLIAAIAVLAIAAIFISAYIPLDFLNSGEAAAFNPTFEEKLRVMMRVYGFILAIFFPIGLIATLRSKGEVEVLTLTITFALFSLVLLQFPYVMKFYVLARFFIHIIVAIGIYAIIRHINSTMLRTTAYALLAIVLIALFITNTAGWKEILRYREMYTNISPNEVQAAAYLQEQYDGINTLLISDPATQHILEPLSMVNTQGGAYMNEKTRALLDQAIKTQDTAEIARIMYQIEDPLVTTTGTRLLVISGRYFLWQYSAPEDKKSLSFNIWYPTDLTPENKHAIHSLLQDPAHFTLVYQNPTLAILEVTQ